MNTSFYVYAFLRLDNTPYYVGKGKDDRAYSKNRVIKPPKDKSRIVFLRTGLTEDKAFEWERFYIKHYGRKDIGTGILRNKTDGGDGHSNPSRETREKHKERMKKILTRMHSKRDETGKSILGIRNSERMHAEKDEQGKSVNARKGASVVHAQKDENGKSINAKKSSAAAHVRKDARGMSVTASKAGKAAHAQKDENGKSLLGLRRAEDLHREKNTEGKSVSAIKGSTVAHSKKDENGKSLLGIENAKRANNQKYEDPDHPELGKHHFVTLKRLQRAQGLPDGKENRRKVM